MGELVLTPNPYWNREMKFLVAQNMDPFKVCSRPRNGPVEKLKVAIWPRFPYSYDLEDGKGLRGWEIDISKAVATCFGVVPEFTAAPSYPKNDAEISMIEAYKKVFISHKFSSSRNKSFFLSENYPTAWEQVILTRILIHPDINFQHEKFL